MRVIALSITGTHSPHRRIASELFPFQLDFDYESKINQLPESYSPCYRIITVINCEDPSHKLLHIQDLVQMFSTLLCNT